MDERLRRHPTSMGRRADIRLDHEVPPPRPGLRATRIRRRNPHHNRSSRNPRQAVALTLLRHALRIFNTFFGSISEGAGATQIPNYNIWYFLLPAANISMILRLKMENLLRLPY